LRSRDIKTVIHFAGSVVVPESFVDPLKYYSNNVLTTRSLLDACIAEGVDKFVNSSSAAVYGMASEPYLREETHTNPVSPYGRSKLVTEWMLQDIAAAHDRRFITLRYFNVAGADAEMRTGQSAPDGTHLIKRACQTALCKAPRLSIFGTDFDTPDGMAVRDYIHIDDLITAHLLALEALRGGASSDVYNCGYGLGVSVREVVAATEKVSGRKIATLATSRRLGDIGRVVADATKIKKNLSWVPQHSDIHDIVRSAFEWEGQLANCPVKNLALVPGGYHLRVSKFSKLRPLSGINHLSQNQKSCPRFLHP
jgi:UDP-glucose 4-epimerase